MINALARAKTSPRTLLTQPSVTSLNIPYKSFPTSHNMINTAMRMRVKDIILRTWSEADIYWVIHSLTIAENLDDAHTPKMMDIRDIACDMKPFLKPWIIAGTKQIKRMISKMFIFL